VVVKHRDNFTFNFYVISQPVALSEQDSSAESASADVKLSDGRSAMRGYELQTANLLHGEADVSVDDVTVNGCLAAFQSLA
jgi:hypothetical protein